MLKKSHLIMLAIGALLSAGGYLLWSTLFYRLGYPLDDAWIYQTYARNLAQSGMWAFMPGVPSGGSTGPLWALLLAAGYLLRLDHFLWSYLLGSAALFALGVTGIWGVRTLNPEVGKLSLLAGAALIFEWHLTWAAGSGMETALSGMLAAGVLVYLLRTEITPRAWFLLGLTIGASIWVRPDGLLLLAPAGFALLLGGARTWRTKFRDGALLLAGFGLLFGLYLLFNQAIAGTIWPNTFYAKQAEYAKLQTIPLIRRYVQQLLLPLTGVGIVLLPGFLLSLAESIRQRRWARLGVFLWFFGYLGAFAWRLPVTYQHGRYVMPAMPIFFILGLAGTLKWSRAHWDGAQMFPRVLAKTWLLLTLLVSGIFWFLGANAFARDTAIIETEMVASAQWIATHTEPGAVVAAHDIGALGYFGGREIIDLAGLISPEVIPFIRDENQLAAYLDSQDADYLMTFPDWYPALTAQAFLVYQTQGEFSPKAGGENIAVYRWR